MKKYSYLQALKLVKNNGKRMKPLCTSRGILYVENSILGLCIHFEKNVSSFELQLCEMMSSWVEVNK